MDKHGTPSKEKATTPGWYLNLVAAVVRNLPRDIDEEMARHYAEKGGEELSGRLRAALMSKTSQGLRLSPLEREIKELGFRSVFHDPQARFLTSDCEDRAGAFFQKSEDLMTARGYYDVRVLESRSQIDVTSANLKALAAAGAWFVGLQGLDVVGGILTRLSAAMPKTITSFASRSLERDMPAPMVCGTSCSMRPRKVLWSGITCYTTFEHGDGLLIVTKA